MCSFDVWASMFSVWSLKQHNGLTDLTRNVAAQTPFPDLLNMNLHLNRNPRCTLTFETHALENDRATTKEEADSLEALIDPPGPWSMTQPQTLMWEK